MSPRQIFATSIGFLLLLTSCIIVVDEHGFNFRDGIRGSGNRVQEERGVPSFTGIELSVPADVLVTIGESSSITLSGDDNLLPLVETDVRRGKLVITDARGKNLRFRERLEIRIVTPSLARFEVEGNGDVEIRGLHGETFDASIEGSGTIVAAGTVDILKASIEGSGDLRLVNLQAREASVSIEGSGEIGVNASETLRYSIEGSGDIRFEGTPHVSGGVQGSGNVRQR